MTLEFPWPYTTGEWLAWSAALTTILIGIFSLFAPRTRLKLSGIRNAAFPIAMLSELRAQSGGMLVGIGIAAILLDQPFVYAALAFGWAFATLGRIISILFDGGRSLPALFGLVVSACLTVLPLLFAFGLIE